MKKRLQTGRRLLPLLFVLFFFAPVPIPLTLAPEPAIGANVPSDFVPNDFWINWNVPRRWYTGLAMTYRVTWYEYDDQDITWSLSNAPSGMTVDNDGTLSWASPVGGTYTSIVLQAARAKCRSTANSGGLSNDFPSCSLTTSITFDLEVSTDTTNSFKFVATTGTNNGSCGTLASPCATLKYTLDNRIPAGTNGVTIYMRGGSYSDGWSTDSITSRLYAATDPLVIIPYPGESPTIAISGGTNGGLRIPQGVTYVDIAIPITGNLQPSGGNYLLSGDNTIVHDVVSGGARVVAEDNSSDVVISGDNAIADRVVSSDNWRAGRAASASGWNNNGFLAYNDLANKTSWIMNSKAYDTETCFKIKHTNCSNAHGGTSAGACDATHPSRTIFHNNDATNCTYGWIGAGAYSSVRFLAVTNVSRAVQIGSTDPSSFTNGPIWFAHLSLKGDTNSSALLYVDSSYLQTTGPFHMFHSILYQDGGSCVNQNPDINGTRALMVAFYYGTQSTVDDYPWNTDYNDYYNSNGDSNCFHLGNTGAAAAMNNTTWRTFDSGAPIVRDPNDITSNPVWGNASGGDYQITSTSPAATSCGGGLEFCGATRPDRTDYGTFGAQNSTLVKWYSSTSSPPVGGSGTVGNYKARIFSRR